MFVKKAIKRTLPILNQKKYLKFRIVQGIYIYMVYHLYSFEQETSLKQQQIYILQKKCDFIEE